MSKPVWEKKALPDTNVLVQFFRHPEQRAQFEAVWNRPLLLLSSVVILELRAGCRDRAENAALDRFIKPFEKASRIVVPTVECWNEAGHTLARMAAAGVDRVRRRQLQNDLLIAVSARRAGATVITANRSDFALIAKHTSFAWVEPLG